MSHKTPGMATSQMDAMMADGTVSAGCLVKLEMYISKNVHGRKIIVLLKCSLAAPACAQIGAPTSWPDGNPAPAADWEHGNEPTRADLLVPACKSNLHYK